MGMELQQKGTYRSTYYKIYAGYLLYTGPEYYLMNKMKDVWQL